MGVTGACTGCSRGSAWNSALMSTNGSWASVSLSCALIAPTGHAVMQAPQSTHETGSM
jgi:hypothetical protein